MQNEFKLISQWHGFSHKTDQTNLPPGYLVNGSQNVLTNDGERVAVRKGYTLDGQANSANTPIESSYDWFMHIGETRNLRSYDDELEYRYEDSSGTVTWRRLANGFTAVMFNWAEFWDTTELIDRLLFVNGTSNIYDWSGGITTFASATGATITKQGVETWAELSFYTTGTRQVVIDGITYTYTGGQGTTTLTGVTPNPTLGAHAVGAVIHQAIRTTANSTMTGIPATFPNDLIAVLQNNIYVASLTQRFVYVSKLNSFTDYSYSSPPLPGDGALLTLDGSVVGMIPQEEAMYITAGKDYWYQTTVTLSADQLNGILSVTRLKTGPRQAAKSQAMMNKIKNSVVFVSNEPTIDTLGRVELIQTPQSTNLSDPIKLSVDSYDFTDGSVFYFRNFTYIAIPAQGIVLVFNHAKSWWEAPQILPISRFAVIDGLLYGHSSQTPETYHLFNGVDDNGNPIDARALFSYLEYGDRAQQKNATGIYTEGYISSNTQLVVSLVYDYKGYSGISEYIIDGGDNSIIFDGVFDGSLGKNSLGKASLGGSLDNVDETLPPKFRIINTFSKTDFYELQIAYSSNGIGQNWELLAFGPNTQFSTSTQGKISK